MSFQRARSNEQKNIRKNEIIQATVNLFENKRYEDITLAGISNELSFTRANLYKYVSTKEEIFLWIMEYEMSLWTDEVKEKFSTTANLNLSELAALWATILYRHKRMLRVYSILSSVIEQNVTVERLSEFKIISYGLIGEIVEVLRIHLPKLSDNQMNSFIDMQLMFLMGLYSMTERTSKVEDAVKLSKIPFHTTDFVKTMSKFTIYTIEGLQNET